MWGLIPSWAKDPLIGRKMINARAETIAEKPSFRASFQRRRCLILADGFYEWKTEPNRRQPYRFSLIDKKPFTFAGIWDHWQDKRGQEITSCTIITTTPNRLLQEYHDRMPVILDKDTRWNWLNPATPVPDLLGMLRPFPDDQMAKPEKIEPKSLYLNKE
jgi:putative SOS response-associated peptidase YedK